MWRGPCSVVFPMSQRWTVILAGGEGTRLRSLTRALYGADVPKQFAVFVGDKSLLQLTVERAARLTRFERILVVVGTKREALARIQLEPYPGVELVVQPRNLDTGPGLLLPLARILARDPDAHVAVLPSDYYVSDATPLLEALRVNTRGRITLLGVTIAPHPCREPLERHPRRRSLRSRMDVAIDCRGIGPVCLDGDRGEPAPRDQLLGDAGPHPIELGGAVRRLAEQHDARVADPADQRVELDVLDPADRLGALRDQLRYKRRSRGRARCAQWPRVARRPRAAGRARIAGIGPTVFAD